MFNRRNEIPWEPLETLEKAISIIKESDPSKEVIAKESFRGTFHEELDLFIEGKKWKFISDGRDTGYFVPERLDLLAEAGYPELAASVAVSGYQMSGQLDKLHFTLAKGEEVKLAVSILQAREMWGPVVKGLTELIEKRDQETETLRAWSAALEKAGIPKEKYLKRNSYGPYSALEPKWLRVISHVVEPGLKIHLSEYGKWMVDGFITTEQHGKLAEIVDRAYRSVIKEN